MDHVAELGVMWRRKKVMSGWKYGWLVIGLFCLALAAGAAEETSAGRVKCVLLVDSHSAADVWTEDLRSGIQAFLREKDLMVNYESYEFGVRYQPGISVAASDIAALQTKLDSTCYDLIIASNNAAADLFLEGRLKPDGRTPLLISAYHGNLTERIPAGLPVTGIETPMNLYDNIRLGLRLKPEARQLVLITEASADGRRQEKLLAADIPEDIPIGFTCLRRTEYTTEDMLQAVSKLPADALIFFHSWSSSREPEPENSYTVLPRIRQASRAAIFGKYDCYLKLGALGGLVAVGREQGAQAGRLAFRILTGENAGDLPVQAGPVRMELDYPALLREGIALDRVPPEAELLHMPPNFLTRYQHELAFGALAVIALLLIWVANLLYRRRTEQKLRAMFANLPLRLVVVNRQQEVLYAHGAELMDGVWGKTFRRVDQLPEALKDAFAAAVDRTFDSGRKQEMDYEAEGRRRHVEFVLLPAVNPFRTRAVMWISGDVTELHKLHRTAAQLAERLRLTLESIGDGVIATDCEERITLINPVAARLTGVAPDEARGKKLDEVFQIVSYLDGSSVESPLKRALATGSVVELANHTDLISRDGSCRHIADSAAPIREADGSIGGGVLVFRDVTDEYEKRDRLRMNSVILNNASKLAQFIYFRYDGSASDIGVGFERNCYWGEKDGRPLPAEEWIAPEDLEAFQTGWRRLRTGEISTLNLVYAAGRGERRGYFEMRVEASKNENSGRLEFFGIIQDVTRARENEFRYRDNLQLLETIINHLPGYLFVKDVEDDCRYIMGNRKLEEVTGLPRERIIGHFDRDIFPADEEARQRLAADDRQVIASGRRLDIQEVFTNARRQRFIVRTIKDMIRRSDGSRLLIGMGIDISHQYRLEQEQRRTIETLNNYIDSERIVNESLTRITLEDDFDRAIDDMLRIIGENAGADRSYIFRYRDGDLDRSDNIYEWVREGIEPEIANLQNVDMTQLPNWKRLLLARREIVIPDIAHPPVGLEPEAEFLSRQSIRSLLVGGIWIDGRLYGYVGLDFVRKQRVFTDCDIHTVHSIVNLFWLARERQQRLNQIADSVALQRQIVENIAVPIVILSLNFEIITANPSMAKLVGQSARKLVGHKCYELVCRNPEPPEWCPMRQTLLDRASHSTETEISGRRCIVTAQPLLDRQGRLRYVLKSEVDITELTRQKEALQLAMEKAQAADRAKSFFLATVSHELRTPLNAVIGFSELLQQGDVAPAEQREYLRSINFAGNALLNLINDVLDLSRLEADQLNMAVARTDVMLLTEEIAAVFKLKAQEKQLALRVECTVRPLLYLDQLRLRQVLLNLIGNAIKFTPSGQVDVRVDFVPESGRDWGTLTVQVADTGIGITPQNIRKIFEPFIQEGATRGNRVYEGSGLGLAISRRLVQKMGGRIEVKSTPEVGSVFTVRIPEVKYDSTGPLRLPAASAEPGKFRVSGPCDVLLVDDVPMNLKVLEAMLKKLGIRSRLAGSGEEALRLLQRQPDCDLVLTDLWMPGMNGSELARRLARQPSTSGLPVVAVTADAQGGLEDSDVFRAVLLKPITVESLQKMLNDILQRK